MRKREEIIFDNRARTSCKISCLVFKEPDDYNRIKEEKGVALYFSSRHDFRSSFLKHFYERRQH